MQSEFVGQAFGLKRVTLNQLFVPSSEGQLRAVLAHWGASVVLRLLAQTLPASMWLTEVRLTEGRIELSGQTQQPEALRPWLDRLRTEPALAGQSLQALKVERSVVSTGVAETWDFRVVNARKGGALP